MCRHREPTEIWVDLRYDSNYFLFHICLSSNEVSWWCFGSPGISVKLDNASDRPKKYLNILFSSCLEPWVSDHVYLYGRTWGITSVHSSHGVAGFFLRGQRLSLNQWVLDPRIGSGLETGQGIVIFCWATYLSLQHIHSWSVKCNIKQYSCWLPL